MKPDISVISVGVEEQLKLEDILQLCADYEKEIEREQKTAKLSSDVAESGNQHRLYSVDFNNKLNNRSMQMSASMFYPSSPTHTLQLSPGGNPLTPNRIKTNGSLPRETRLGSPPLTLSGSPVRKSSFNQIYSEEEVNGFFSFLAFEGSSPRGTLTMPRTEPSSRTGSSSNANFAETYSSDSSQHSNGKMFPMPNQSPRTRIKTTASLYASHPPRIKPKTGTNEAQSDYATTPRTSKDFKLHTNGNGETNYFNTSADLSQPPARKLPPVPTRKQSLPEASNSLEFQSSRDQYCKTFLAADYGSSFTRKPPRSKHDSSGFQPDAEVHFPSQDAASRVLIGTLMLNNGNGSAGNNVVAGNHHSKAPQNRPFQMMNMIHNSSMEQPYSFSQTKQSSLSREENVVRSERSAQVHIISALKRKLAEHETNETEEIQQLELEFSLLAAELDEKNAAVAKAQARLSNLRSQENRSNESLKDWQESTSKQMEEAELKMQQAETVLRRLEGEHSKFLSFENCSFDDGPDAFVEQETMILEQIKQQHDIIEMERKAFEDLEFQQMETEAQKESEKEELLRDISDLEREISRQKLQISEIENQQRVVLSSVKREMDLLEDQRQYLINEIEKEQSKLSHIESQLNSLSMGHDYINLPHFNADKTSLLERRLSPPSLDNLLLRPSSDEDEDDSDFAEDMSVSRPRNLSHRNTELTASLSRLALLEQELAKFDVPRTSEGKRNKEHNKLSKSEWTTSQPMVDSSSEANNEGVLNFVSKSEFNVFIDSPGNSGSDRQSASMLTQKSATFMDLSFSDNNSPSDLNYRPVSEMSSCWDEFDSFGPDIKRRDNKARLQQRPLTRYLPVRQNDFDLRSHIESAGHAIDSCQHLLLNSNSCRGYLLKMSSHRGLKLNKWSKRWFVFDRIKRTFVYFADKNESKAKGGMGFQAIQEVYVDHLNSVKSPHPSMTFCIKTCERTYYLIAGSPDAMRIWVDVIFTGAEGYLEF